MFRKILFIVFICSLFLTTKLSSQSQNEYTSDANTVLLLHLNETTGNIANDASSFSNHGTINGNIPSEGKFNGGMQCPSNNTELGIALPNSSSLNILGSFTVEAWIKTDSYELAGTTIFAHDEYQLALGSFGSSGYLQVFRHVGNEWIIYQSTVQIPLNEWVQVAGTWDENEAKLFINAVQVDITITANPYTPVGVTRAAAHYGSVLVPNSITFIDEIRISNVPRTVDVENSTFTLLAFDLKQNYPNPFNPTTKISWQSKASSHQTLKVYDVLGNEVATLVDDFKNSGSYEVTFDGSKFSSGVYFYQLKVGDYIQTRKMILMK